MRDSERAELCRTASACLSDALDAYKACWDASDKVTRLAMKNLGQEILSCDLRFVHLAEAFDERDDV